MSETATIEGIERTLYESASTIVRRGSWNGQPAILKSLHPDAPHGPGMARLYHEYQVNQALTSHHVCRALAFAEATRCLIFEDRQCRALRELIAPGRLTLDERIGIAIAAAEALQSIHDEGVIHRDINPGNLVVGDDDRTVYLIDFGFATFAPREYPLPDTTDAPTGTLLYISPEQTGRINRIVDYRTDLYSLGATLHELFGGLPPFTHSDPLELLHAHIASQPPALHAIDPAIPRWLSDVVQRLLAKQPEERYQSAAALRDDLINGRHHSNVIPFRLGKTDAPRQLALPKRLYGRETALDTIFDLLERVTDGESLIAEIIGATGSGRSAMADSLARSARDSGYLVARLEAPAWRRHAATDIWLELVRLSARQALASSSADVTALLDRLAALPAEHRRNLREHLPELARRLGADDAAPASIEQTITATLRCFHPLPLCVILEDTDTLAESELETLLDIASSGRQILTAITQQTAEPLIAQSPRLATKRTQLQLAPLERGDVRKLLADMLSLGEMRVRELAAVLHTKTAGMPGPLIDLIFELHNAGLITYVPERREWTWHLDAVTAHYFSREATDRIEYQLIRLDAFGLQALQAAAAIGEQFSADLIGTAFGWSASETATAFRPALTGGLLRRLPLDGGEPGEPLYQFTHYRIREHVYAGLDEPTRVDMHNRIATALGQRGRPDSQATLLVADHLNAATDLLDAPISGRVACAEANHAASRVALQQGASQQAYKYARAGLAMNLDASGEQAGLVARLEALAADAAFQCGDFDHLQYILDEAHPGNERIEEIRLRAAVVRNDLEGAEAIARAALDRLGAPVPDGSSRWGQWLPRAARDTVDRLHRRLGQRPDGESVPATARPASEPTPRQVFRLQGYLLHIGYHRGTNGLSTLAHAMHDAAMREGAVAEASFAAAALAVSAIAGQDPASARELAARSRELAAQCPDTAFAQRALTLLAGTVLPWCEPLDPQLTALGRYHRSSWQLGDFEFAAAASAFGAWNGLLRGSELTSLRQQLRDQTERLARQPHVTDVNLTRFLLGVLDTLSGDNSVQGDEDELPTRHNPQDVIALGTIYVLRLYLAVLLLDFRGAEAILPLARSHGARLTASPLLALLAFCDALVTLRNRTESPAAIRQRVRKAHQQLMTWSEWGAQFTRAKALILAAESEWLDGNRTRALEYYEQAAESARRSGLGHDEGLACELAGRRCNQDNRPDFARLFIQNAHASYLRWGARAKTRQLERDFASFLHDRPEQRPLTSVHPTALATLRLDEITSLSPSLAGNELNDRALEVSTVLRAAQTISGEVRLDEVLTRLLRLALEHAGAQRACMLLARDERLYVEAIADVDAPEARRLAPATPVGKSEDVPESIVQFVAQTQEALVLPDATSHELFAGDRYVQALRPLSVLCLPIIHRGTISGILYLEHRTLSDLFTRQRVEILALLASQAAVSIENARLYTDLQATRDEYRTLYDNAVEGLFRINTNGVLQTANPTLARILGFADVLQLLDEYREFMESVFLSRETMSQFLSELDDQRIVSTFETRGVQRDGQTFWMALSARLVREADGHEYIDGSLIDISGRIERDQAEKQRQIAEAATQAKSAFLANMSHEIRTPMNAVLGFSKLALETQLDQKQYEYVSSIRNAAENLLDLINDILDFSKIEAGKLSLEVRPFKLTDVVREVTQLFRTEVRRKNLELVVTDRTTLHPAMTPDTILLGDALRLQQVLVNLVGNAVKFTSRGEIRITVDVQAHAANDLQLAFAVSDTGIGISEQDQLRLFESFEQAELSTTRRFGGTGLGLTICKRLVEIMGGTIGIESEPGTGSTFRFTARFACSSEPDVRPDPGPSRARNVAVLQGRRLLVAEDNPINQQLALEFLQRAGAEVEIAENGREAVARATAAQYDAVLMDIHMPQLDGLGATRILREQGLQLPILAVSADALGSHRTKALEAGCDSYITKPIDFDQLLGELGRLLPDNAVRTPRRRASDRPIDRVTEESGTSLPDERESSSASAEDEAAGADAGATPGGASDAPAGNRDKMALGADSTLRRLPGIDVGAAIKGHNGNIPLMLKLMADFGRYYGDAGPRMRNMVTSDALEDAERLAHNLHGVAGSFGAHRLQKASKTLELELAQRSGSHLLGLVQGFEIALDEVLQSADALANGRVPLRASDRADP